MAQTAPELRVPYWLDPQGQPRPELRLAELGEQYKLLYCFQHWCPGCHSHGFPTLQGLVGLPALKVAVIQTVFEGYEENTRDQLLPTQQRYDLGVPFGHDSNPAGRPSIMEDYATGGTPWFILIDPANQVVFSDFRINGPALVEAMNASTPAANDATPPA